MEILSDVLSEIGIVDKLSLYLCMRDSDDERVQLECDTLIKGMNGNRN